jgi:hypothetical protein
MNFDVCYFPPSLFNSIPCEYQPGRFLPHRFAAAFRAIALRFAADKFLARTLPPLLAPSLLRATACGLRVSTGGTIGGPVLVAAATTAWAICTKSGLLARVGMTRL